MSSDSDDQDEGGLFDRPLWRLWIPMLLVPVAVGQAFLALVEYDRGASLGAVTIYLAQTGGLLLIALWIFAGWPPIPSGDE